jgi:hypothetical protein
MARLTPAMVNPTQTGAVVTMAAPNVDGDAIPANGTLLVTNANAGVLTITVDTPGTVGDGLSIGDHTLTVAAGTTELIGPFREQHFKQTSGATKGMVHVGYSIQASITRAVLGLS